jgi:hypothetical protein
MMIPEPFLNKKILKSERNKDDRVYILLTGILPHLIITVPSLRDQELNQRWPDHE